MKSGIVKTNYDYKDQISCANKNGFSLIELLAVIAIIGILAVIGMPQYQKHVVIARQGEAKIGLNAIYTAQNTFFLEYDGYHSSLKVIGYAPLGKVRFNIGFSLFGVSIDPPKFGAPYAFTERHTFGLCTGPFGGGTDLNCNIPRALPFIPATAFATTTAYTAQAVGYESSMFAENEIQKSNLELLLYTEKAHAGDMTLPYVMRTVQQWSMTSSKSMSNSTRTGLDLAL